jgi:phosphoglycolate phosphatase-like HAD superfamily hydrolase
MKLVLFDIDGTLIEVNGAGRKAMHAALTAVVGTAGPLDRYDMAGQLDPVIIHEVLSAAGIPAAEITAILPALYQAMAKNGAASFHEDGITACPGVIRLLDALRGRPGILLGLLTGNIRETAPLKLAAAGIDPAIFPIGAYGTDADVRDDLPAVAWQRATALVGEPFGGHNTVIVGDTPADILCARHSGSRAVAVATGRFSVAALARYKPDCLLENLADLEKSIECITRRQTRTMNERKTIVADVTLKSDAPTLLTFEQLRTWVIWQYPRRRAGGLCGAVHPPLAQFAWLPAIVRPKERQVEVHAHVGREFDTPRAAADWLFG